MSQFNETTDLKEDGKLKGITMFKSSVDTPIESGDKLYKCNINMQSNVENITNEEKIYKSFISLPTFKETDEYKAKITNKLSESVSTYRCLCKIDASRDMLIRCNIGLRCFSEYKSTVSISREENSKIYKSNVSIVRNDKDMLYKSSLKIWHDDIENNYISLISIPTNKESHAYNATFETAEIKTEDNFIAAIGDIVGYNDISYMATSRILEQSVNSYPAVIKILASNSTFVRFEVQGAGNKEYKAHVTSWDDREKLYSATTTIPTFRSDTSYKSNFSNIKADISKTYQATVSIHPSTMFNINYSLLDGNRSMFKAHTKVGKEYTPMYMARFSIDPTSTLLATGDIVGFGDSYYKSTVKTIAKEVKSYPAMVKIMASNSVSIKFEVQGAGNKEYRALVTSWDDREKLYPALVTIPTVKERPMIPYKSTVRIVGPTTSHAYNANVAIHPNTMFNIDYGLLSGGDHQYKAFTVVGKEYDNMYKARFIINPTNSLQAIGDVVGYEEHGYKSMVSIQEEKSNVYQSMVRIKAHGHMHTKIEVDQTPQHLFYGDLKKDAHVIETNPTSNYGGDKTLFMNDKSEVFLEWDFDINLDKFYEPHLEFNSGLRLYLRRALSGVKTGTVYQVHDNWEEYGINYDNRPRNITKIRDFEIPHNHVGRLDIPLYDLFESINKQDEPFTISLMVKIDTDVNTLNNSKETGWEVPALYYSYYYIPPNNRQKEYLATVRISKAYGMGNDKDTEFPDLGEELPWSKPAKIYRANVTRAKTEPINTYMATVKILSFLGGYQEDGDTDGLYRATTSVYNLKTNNFLGKANMTVPKWEVEGPYYDATLNVPIREINLFKAMVVYKRRKREPGYLATVDIIKGYGVGDGTINGEQVQFPDLGQEDKWSGEAPHWLSKFKLLKLEEELKYLAEVDIIKGYGVGDGTIDGEEVEFPDLGQEDKWSGEAPHWKCRVSISATERDISYLAKATILRAYGKGSGSGTEFPGLGEEQPWSQPAPHWRAIVRIPTFKPEEDSMYKAIFFNDDTRYHYYKSSINVPLFKPEEDPIYKANVFIMQRHYNTFPAGLYIPTENDEHLYKAHTIVHKTHQFTYNATVRYVADRSRVHIFIM